MLNFIDFLNSLQDISEDKLKETILNKLGNLELNYSQFINPGDIIDMQIGDDISHGIVLSNKALLLINPKTHMVIGYLTNYTNITPYKMLRIRRPNNTSYKYTDSSIPVVWEAEPEKTEMSMEDIEKALGIKSGTLVIK